MMDNGLGRSLSVNVSESVVTIHYRYRYPCSIN